MPPRCCGGTLAQLLDKHGTAIGNGSLFGLQPTNASAEGCGHTADLECHSFWTWDHLTAAIDLWNAHHSEAAAFLHEPDPDDQARTLAALLANVYYESDLYRACKERLKRADGTCPADELTSVAGGCSMGRHGDYTTNKSIEAGFSVVTCGGNTGATCTDFWGNALEPAHCWFGRGALQLSWPGNYDTLAAPIKLISGIDVCEDPDAICRNGTLGFLAAIGYWATNSAPWDAAPRFAASLDVIKPADTSTNAARLQRYRQHLSELGVEEWSMVSPPPMAPPAPPMQLSPTTPPPSDPPTSPSLPQVQGVTVRCGTDWADANSRCGVPCPSRTNADCPDGEVCSLDLSPCYISPSPPPPRLPLPLSPTPAVPPAIPETAPQRPPPPLAPPVSPPPPALPPVTVATVDELVAAVANASVSVVILAAGTYELSSRLELHHDIVLMSNAAYSRTRPSNQPPPANGGSERRRLSEAGSEVILDGMRVTRVIYVAAGVACELIGLTITRGYGTAGLDFTEDYLGFGGGVEHWGSTLRMVQVTFLENNADYGGGLYSYGETVRAKQCNFVNNSARLGGHAIYIRGDKSTLDFFETSNTFEAGAEAWATEANSPGPTGTSTLVGGGGTTIVWTCNVGQYAPRADVTLAALLDSGWFFGCPLLCPAGFNGTGTDFTSFECAGACPPGFVCPEGNSAPTPCPHGTEMPYSRATDVTDCKPCSRGTTNPDIGQAECMPCAPGSFTSQTGQTACVDCPAGKYCPVAGGDSASVALNCPGGSFSAKPGLSSQDQCSRCPAGDYCRGNGETMSYACTLGHFCPANSTVPQRCQPGQYQDEEGSEACKTCPQGFYCTDGSASPSPCLAGTYGAAAGLSSSGDCQDCPAGFYCPPESTEPTPCPNGTAGALERLGDLEFCTDCVSPKTSDAGATVCTTCKAEYYSTFRAGATDNFTCSPCLYGAVCPANTELRSVTLLRGSWRLSPFSSAVYRCGCGADLAGRDCELKAVVELDGVDEDSVCIGGSDGGEDGDGYCAAGHRGPLCRVCVKENASSVEGEAMSARYFDAALGRCRDCPLSRDAQLGLTAAVIIGVGIFAALAYQAWTRPPSHSSGLMRAVHVRAHRVANAIAALALTPKLKLLIAFYQSATAVPKVYVVSLPDEINDLLSSFSWIRLDWTSLGGAPECVASSYVRRLLLRGVAPLGLMGGLLVLSVCRHMLEAMCCCRHRRGSSSASPSSLANLQKASALGRDSHSDIIDAEPSEGDGCCAAVGRVLRRSLLQVLPWLLFLAFSLCVSVSSALFDAYACIAFDAGGETATVTSTQWSSSLVASRREFLADDLSIECGSAAHDEVRQVGFVLVAIWAILTPLVLAAMLFANHSALVQRRSTRYTRALAFLHSEYRPECYWWEPLYMLQRLAVVGFVQFVPLEKKFVRLLTGVLLTLLYLMGLLLASPFKRRDLNFLASVGAQFTLLCVLLSAMVVQLFDAITAENGVAVAAKMLGFNSSTQAAVGMILFVCVVVLLFVAVSAWQALTRDELSTIRLSDTGELPVLSLGRDMAWHLFLSHIWSSGQDQVAIIKRQLQLLLPGIRVFLDVDDLEEIGELPRYIEASQSVLLFLSRGYFFSGNCRKELAAALEYRKPLILVHEGDTSRGGATLAQLRADCKEAAASGAVGVRSTEVGEKQQSPLTRNNARREHLVTLSNFVFGPDDAPREVITWQRVSHFQVVTLKNIAAGLLYASNAFKQPPKLRVPGEIGEKRLGLPRAVCLHVSAANPGADAMAAELKAYLGAEEPLELTDGGIAPAVEDRGSSSGSRGHSRSSSSSIYLPRLSVRTPGAPGLLRTFSRRSPAADRATHMLLYLNEATFVGELGVQLAKEVRYARAHGLSMLLVHEVDESRRGTAFDTFFSTTPQDLIHEGVYRTIAVAYHPEPFRQVSHALAAKVLGAVQSSRRLRRKMRHALKATATATTVATKMQGTLVQPSSPPPAAAVGESSPQIDPSNYVQQGGEAMVDANPPIEDPPQCSSDLVPLSVESLPEPPVAGGPHRPSRASASSC